MPERTVVRAFDEFFRKIDFPGLHPVLSRNCGLNHSDAAARVFSFSAASLQVLLHCRLRGGDVLLTPFDHGLEYGCERAAGSCSRFHGVGTAYRS